MKQPFSGVLENSPDMVSIGIAFRFALLGHDVGNIDFKGIGAEDRLGDPIYQQVGNDAGVQASRPQQDHIRRLDSLDGRLQGRRPLRDQPYPADPAVLPFFTIEDLGLSQHLSAVFKLSLQLDVGSGDRQHRTGNGQNLAHPAHSLVKAVRYAV